MFKALMIVAWLGFVFLLGATIILGSLNWNKFYTQFGALGLALAGTLAGLCTLGVILKGDTFSSAFTTFIIVNTDNHLPISPNDVSNFTLAQDPNSLMHRSLEYAGLASPKIQDQSGNEILLFEGPQNDQDETRFYEELLQYRLLIEIIKVQNPHPWVTVRVGTPGFSVGKSNAFGLTQFTNQPIVGVAPEVTTNRFSRNPVEQETIKVYPSRLPTNTRITLGRGEPSERISSETHSLVLVKPHFFRLEIVITPGSGSGTKNLPANSGVLPDIAAKCKTLTFEISMRAEFEKLTTGNYRTEELKNWARWVFSQLETKFSDNSPEG